MKDDQPVANTSKVSWFRRLRRIFKRIGLVVVVLVAIYLLFGFCYERAALRRIARDLPPPGKRVDIGGRSIHLKLQGEGSPTVIFESGLGASSVVWDLVAPKVAKATRVVTYDRAGLGWSDPGPESNVDGVVADLRAALHAAGIEGPYVLVGQSIGGLYVRMFSYQHPSDVAGIVLVDSSHEDQFDQFPESLQRRFRRLHYFLPIVTQSARFGIPRMWLAFRGDEMLDKRLPPESQRAIRMLSPTRTALRKVQYELRALPTIGAQVRAQQIPWNDLPLVVLTAGKQMPGLPPDVAAAEVHELWIEFQQELASRSTNSRHRIVSRNGHNIHIEQPEIVIEEILQLLETGHARHGSQ